MPGQRPPLAATPRRRGLNRLGLRCLSPHFSRGGPSSSCRTARTDSAVLCTRRLSVPTTPFLLGTCSMWTNTRTCARGAGTRTLRRPSASHFDPAPQRGSCLPADEVSQFTAFPRAVSADPA